MGQGIAALKRVRDSSLLSCFELAVGYVAVEILADAINFSAGITLWVAPMTWKIAT